jgi:uncharacterized protein (DUF433 family)
MASDRIVVDPRIMAGKPVVRGTRIPVELVLKRLSQDLSIQTSSSRTPGSPRTTSRRVSRMPG